MTQYSGEPSLAELLADPIMHQMMRADGCDIDCLNAIIDKIVPANERGFGCLDER